MIYKLIGGMVLAFLLASLSQAQTILPHILQGGGWSTAFHVYNLCARPASFEMELKSSTFGLPEYFDNGEDEFSIFYHPSIPPNSMVMGYLPNTAVEREGYAEMADDGGGCVKISTFHVQHEEDGDGARYVRVPEQSLSSAGVILPFLHFPGCDTSITLIRGDGEVTVEALLHDGSSLGQKDFWLPTKQEIFWLSEAIPATLPAPGSAGQFGTLKISGHAGAIGLDFCDGLLGLYRSSYPIPGTTPTSQAPSGEQYVVEAFEATHTHNDSFGGQTYSYRLTLRNPTDRTHSYKATMRISNLQGATMATAILPPSPFSISAGQSRTVQGSVGREDGIVFATAEAYGGVDPKLAKLTVEIEVVR